VPDHHLGGPVTDQPGERSTDIGDELFVDFLTDQAAYVIRLDDAMDSRGGPRHRTPC